MKPIEFPEALKDLQPSGKKYSDNVIAVKSLPIWTDGEQCVSKWRLSWRERLVMLIRGTVWVQVLSGDSQPPIAFWTGKKFFQPSGVAMKLRIKRAKQFRVVPKIVREPEIFFFWLWWRGYYYR